MRRPADSAAGGCRDASHGLALRGLRQLQCQAAQGFPAVLRPLRVAQALDDAVDRAGVGHQAGQRGRAGVGQDALEQALADTRTRQLLAYVQLYKALGGGWNLMGMAQAFPLWSTGFGQDVNAVPAGAGRLPFSAAAADVLEPFKTGHGNHPGGPFGGGFPGESVNPRVEPDVLIDRQQLVQRKAL